MLLEVGRREARFYLGTTLSGGTCIDSGMTGLQRARVPLSRRRMDQETLFCMFIYAHMDKDPCIHPPLWNLKFNPHSTTTIPPSLRFEGDMWMCLVISRVRMVWWAMVDGTHVKEEMGSGIDLVKARSVRRWEHHFNGE